MIIVPTTAREMWSRDSFEQAGDLRQCLRRSITRKCLTSNVIHYLKWLGRTCDFVKTMLGVLGAGSEATNVDVRHRGVHHGPTNRQL